MSTWPALIVIAVLGAVCVMNAAWMNDHEAKARKVCWDHSMQDHRDDILYSRDQCLEDLGYKPR